MELRNEDIISMMRTPGLASMSRKELIAEIERVESGELSGLYLSRCHVAACKALLESRVFGQPIR
jgi:hypothetical protein